MARDEMLRPATDFFPPYQKWVNFLKTQPNKSFPDIIQPHQGRNGFIYTTFSTPSGVENTIEYINKGPSDEVNLKPSLITQAKSYDEIGAHFRAYLNSDYFGTEFNIGTKDNSKIQEFHIRSLYDVKRKKSTNTVFFTLSTEFLRKLKKEGSIDEKASNIVSHSIDNEGNIIFTIQAESTEQIPITEDIMRRIMQEAGFEYEIDPTKCETRAQYKGHSIVFKHIKPSFVSEDKIWKSVTDTGEKPNFIFPIKIKKLKKAS